MNIRINKIPLDHFKGDLDKTRKDFVRILTVMAGVAIASQFAIDLIFGLKAILIFAVSIFVAKETEIFFLTQKQDIPRDKAKVMTKDSRPEITGMIFALLLPVGTPLFVVAVGSFISIFVGKMIFGGYSFNVFNPAIVGRLFVSIAWPALVTLQFPKTIDNYVLQLIFKKDLTKEVLSPLMELQAQGIVTMEGLRSLPHLLFAPNYGMLFGVPAIAYLVLIVVLIVRKTIDLRPLIFSLFATLITLSVITIGFKLPVTYEIFHIVTGGLFFVSLFMMTDPFTKPYSTKGMIHYSVIFTVVYLLIRFLGRDADGTLYALLFANLFVPLINKKTATSTMSFSLKNVVTILILLSVLTGTGLFINKILDQRIISKQIVVSENDKE